MHQVQKLWPLVVGQSGEIVITTSCPAFHVPLKSNIIKYVRGKKTIITNKTDPWRIKLVKEKRGWFHLYLITLLYTFLTSKLHIASLFLVCAAQVCSKVFCFHIIFNTYTVCVCVCVWGGGVHGVKFSSRPGTFFSSYS